MKIKTLQFDSDHRIIVAALNMNTEKNEKKYMSTHLTTKLDASPEIANYANKLMEELKHDMPKPPPKADQRYQSWISQETWKVIDAKAEVRHCGDTEKVRELKKMVLDRHPTRPHGTGKQNCGRNRGPADQRENTRCIQHTATLVQRESSAAPQTDAIR
jgi:hypothetical protein